MIKLSLADFEEETQAPIKLSESDFETGDVMPDLIAPERPSMLPPSGDPQRRFEQNQEQLDKTSRDKEIITKLQRAIDMGLKDSINPEALAMYQGSLKMPEVEKPAKLAKEKDVQQKYPKLFETPSIEPEPMPSMRVEPEAPIETPPGPYVPRDRGLEKKSPESMLENIVSGFREGHRDLLGYAPEQALATITQAIDYVPGLVRGTKETAKQLWSAAIGQEKAQQLEDMSYKIPVIGQILKMGDKVLDASGKLRADSQALLMQKAMEEGGLVGAGVAQLVDTVEQTLMMVQTMKAVGVGYGTQAGVLNTIKSAGVRAALMTASQEGLSLKERLPAFALGMAYQSTPALSGTIGRWTKSDWIAKFADVTANAGITATQWGKMHDQAVESAEAQGSPEMAGFNMLMSAVQSLGSDVVFGAMTRAFKKTGQTQTAGLLAKTAKAVKVEPAPTTRAAVEEKAPDQFIKIGGEITPLPGQPAAKPAEPTKVPPITEIKAPKIAPTITPAVAGEAIAPKPIPKVEAKAVEAPVAAERMVDQLRVDRKGERILGSGKLGDTGRYWEMPDGSTVGLIETADPSWRGKQVQFANELADKQNNLSALGLTVSTKVVVRDVPVSSAVPDGRQPYSVRETLRDVSTKPLSDSLKLAVEKAKEQGWIVDLDKAEWGYDSKGVPRLLDVSEFTAPPAPRETQPMLKPTGEMQVKPVEKVKPEVELGAAQELVKPTERPLDAAMDKKVKQTRADLEKESTSGFISVFLGKQKQRISGGVAPVREVMEAGRRYPPGPIKKIVERTQNIGRVFTENFVTFMRRNKANPQFIDDWRTKAMPLRDRQIRKVLEWRFGTEGKVFKHEGKAGVNRVMDIVFTKDLIARGEEGLDLPNGVTLAELRPHLTWLESTASSEVRDAAGTIRKIFDTQGRELVQRGKIPATRKEYAPHTVMEYEPGWTKQKLNFPMKTKFGEPYRGYTKQAIGSKRLIRTDEEGLWSNIFKVEMDNAQEDTMLDFAQRYDKKSSWAKTQKGDGKSPSLHKGQRVEINGKPHVAIEWKKTFFKAQAVDENMMKEAVESDMLMREWVDMRGPKGGKPIKPVVAVGKPKLFLVPEEIAFQLKNMTEKSPDIFNLVYEAGRATQIWKKFTLGTAGLQYHGGNILGDTMNTLLFDPMAMAYFKPATRVAEKLFFNKNIKLSPFEQRLHDLSVEKDVALSGQYASELRKYTGSVRAGGLYDRVSGFREALNRLAVLAHQLARVESGKKVQRVAGINLEGLDGRSAAGKVARDALVDYSAVPRAYTLFLSRMATPFVRFHEANARNHLRAAFKTPESSLKYWLPLVTAYGSAFAWNNSEKNKKDEMALPDWIRDRLHVVYGRNKEGKIRVWAPQQPIDMAWSWLGMDHISRILSDKKNGRIKTWKDASKEFLSKMAQAPGENFEALINPALQLLVGLNSNIDPFTNRKVMPDPIFKLYKEAGFANSLLDKRTRGLVVNYVIEKLVSPVAQYTQIRGGTEYTPHPVFDLFTRNFLGLGRAVGFRTLDPISGELGEKMSLEKERAASQSYWRKKTFDILHDYGRDEKMIKALKADAPDKQMQSKIDSWANSIQADLVVIKNDLRKTQVVSERKKLLEDREELIRRVRRMPEDLDKE